MELTIIKTGLTGNEKKIAKEFGGVAVYEYNGHYIALYAGKDVYSPAWEGATIMHFADASGLKPVLAARELIRVTQARADMGRPFYVGDKTDEPEQSVNLEDLIQKGFLERILPRNTL